MLKNRNRKETPTDVSKEKGVGQTGYELAPNGLATPENRETRVIDMLVNVTNVRKINA